MTSSFETDELKKLRFPIGPFEFGKIYSAEDLQLIIRKIEEFPAELKKLVSRLKDAQLDVSYREGGWTVRQVVHHLADSHINAYTRFKLALTEETPSIKPYDEKAWAELADSKAGDIRSSVELLVGLHYRWTLLLKAMSAEDFQLLYYHPEHQMSHHLMEMIAMYAWHGDHHLAHIKQVTEKKTAPKTKPIKAVTAKTLNKKQQS
jgi:hypothetical protein